MIEIGTLLQDRYLIEKQIGAGGMGAVYLAIDQRFGSPLAIKETFYKDEELGEAFEREAHLLNSLHHPVLPHVSDYFTENNGHFLVMQFIDGEDLFITLKREGAFPVQDVVRWTDSLLDALDYLHSQEPPVIHRDIKPQNLKITPRGDIILLDFGLAKLNSSDATGAVSVFGYSRTYSPLEQIQGTGTDARSDIFALGATVYHLLTGIPPIDVLARAAEIVAGNPDPLELASEIKSEVTIEIAIVLKSALALNPAQRFVSANAMRQALQYAVNTDTIEKVEILPLPMATAVLPVNQMMSSVETEDFPALESFADNVKDSSQTVIDENIAAIQVEPIVQTALPVSESLPPPTYIGDIATKVSNRTNQSRFPLAALAAILILVGLASAYFISKSNSSNELKQNPIVQTAEESNADADQPATDSILTIPEISSTLSTETAATSEAKPVSKKTTPEKREDVETQPEPEVEEADKPTPAPASNEVSRPNPVQNRNRTETQTRSRRTASNEDETETVSDIESIFTGRQSDKREDLGERRQNDQISDEERREIRRQRRQERRQRRNNQPLPF
jgi:serine/threonine protein kinase